VRVVGIDLGARRIGIAVSDPGGRLASPERTIERTGDAEADRAAIAAVVTELGATRVVVGLPLSLDGGAGPAAVAAREEIDALARVVGVPVEAHDERFSTVTASRALAAGGTRGRARRRRVDRAAAAVILQSWLDAQR
jgi:putative Holliday junction resolvase